MLAVHMTVDLRGIITTITIITVVHTSTRGIMRGGKVTILGITRDVASMGIDGRGGVLILGRVMRVLKELRGRGGLGTEWRVGEF